MEKRRISYGIFTVVLLVVLMPSVLAAAQVQHSVNGNKVTFTLTGTPPYLINIRADGDVNAIGQNGGYAWIRATTNSYTVDLPFIPATQKIVYGVREASDTSGAWVKPAAAVELGVVASGGTGTGSVSGTGTGSSSVTPPVPSVICRTSPPAGVTIGNADATVLKSYCSDFMVLGNSQKTRITDADVEQAMLGAVHNDPLGDMLECRVPCSSTKANLVKSCKDLTKNEYLFTVIDQCNPKEHTMRFFFVANFFTSDAEKDAAKTQLVKYVEDMNAILSKNTNRRLKFNPEIGTITPTAFDSVTKQFTFARASADQLPISPQTAGIVIVQSPDSGFVANRQTGMLTALPTENFEIWAEIAKSDRGYSHSGNAQIDSSGAGSSAPMYWHKLYDPTTLTAGSEDLTDYWKQINNFLHETGHMLGVGLSEYYNTARRKDTTGVPPTQDLESPNAQDPYWSSKKEFYLDPMLYNVMSAPIVPTSFPRNARSDILNVVQYSRLTAGIMSSSYRGKDAATIPDINTIKLKVIDGSNMPVTGAEIKVFKTYQYDKTELLTQGTTDAQGQMTFAWGTDPWNNFENLRLIKINKAGLKPVAKYISIFDAQEVKVLEGKDAWEMTIRMEPS